MAPHPRRAAWKLFFTANLERALPGLGMAALVQQTHYPTSHARAQGRLSPRHAAYIDAFRQVGLQRQVPHSDMTAEQIRLELLVGNHRRRGAGAKARLAAPPLTSANILCPAQLPKGRWGTEGEVCWRLSAAGGAPEHLHA